MAKAGYKRVLLKLSGEALLGQSGYGIDPNGVFTIAEEIKSIWSLGVDVAVVIGGGNIWRGRQTDISGKLDEKHRIERVTADYMGMLATVINALALQDALEKLQKTPGIRLFCSQST